MRRLFVALILLATPCLSAPRAGVGGVIRMGYGGVLLRAGIPFDYLTTAEQCDPKVLARYDVILQAGMAYDRERWRSDAEAALDQYVRAGGKLICEMDVRLPGAMGKWKLDGRWSYPKRVDRNFALVPTPDRPRFAAGLKAGKVWECGGPISVVRGLPPQARTLARFVEGPARDQPAAVALDYGRGRLIFMAPLLSYVQGNWRGVYDDLILAAVTDLTDGRLRRVWATEAGDTVTPPEPAAPEAAELPGLTLVGSPGEGGYAVRIPVPPATARRRLVLDRGEDRIDTTLTADRLTEGGRELKLPAGRELVILRTASRLNVLLDGRGLVSLPRRGPAGPLYADSADGLTFQPLESLYFADDFTKEGPLTDPWRAPRGEWLCGGPHRLDSAVPGFAVRAWSGSARTGSWFWTEQTLSVAVQPRSAQAVRLELGRWDDANRLEAWVPVDRGGGALVLWRGGQRQVLAEGLPALPRLQWSRVALSARDGRASLSVDGQTRSVPLATPLAGGIALDAQQGDALFDDVEVSDGDDATRAARAVHPARFDKGPEGLLDRDTWAHPAACWLPVSANRFEYVGRLVGDFTLTLPVREAGGGSRLTVGAQRDGKPDVYGDWDASKLAGGGGVQISRRAGEMTVRRFGDGRDERRVFLASGSVRPWVEVSGLSLAAGDLDVKAADVLEYIADQAPADFWATEGDWTVGSRWPCTPEYAWMIGSSPGWAALWTKHAYDGPQTVWTYLGVRMQGAYATEEGEPFKRLRVTLGGNGRDPLSGYVVELGSDVQGFCRLYRYERPHRKREDWQHRPPVVATAARDLANQREVHNMWGSLRIDRDGPRIRVWYQNQPLLDYTDPKPLPGGQVALWTERNAVVTPYFAVFGAASAKPREMPRDLQKQRLDQDRGHRSRPGFNPLPATHALERMLPWLARLGQRMGEEA